MAEDPTIIQAVPKTKNTAQAYNSNFAEMVRYVKEMAQETETYTDSALTNFVAVNSLASSGDVALTVNTVNKTTPTGAINFQLPTITDNTKYYQIYVMLDLTTYYNVGLGVDWSFDNTLPTITQAGKYNLIYEWDGSNWVVGILKRTAVA